MTEAPVTVVAQTPDQIAAARAVAPGFPRPLRIFTAPWMAGAYGVLGIEAGDAVLDCGADAGAAMAALRSGWTRIAFSGPRPVRRKLADMARKAGAALIDAPEAPDIVLAVGDDAAARLRAWAAQRRPAGAAASDRDRNRETERGSEA